jgi:hypothetical protein
MVLRTVPKKLSPVRWAVSTTTLLAKHPDYPTLVVQADPGNYPRGGWGVS